MQKKFSIILLSLIFLFCISQTCFGAEGERVYIYKDFGDSANKAVWANIMPARAAEKNMASFKSSFSPGFDGKGTCIRIYFDVSQPPAWAGVVAAVQQDYWGEWPAKGLDLSKAKKLVFYAKGEKSGEQIQIKAAIAGDKQYGDSALFPIASELLPLDTNWKRYEIPVDGTQLKRVITPFVVVANRPSNPNGTLTVYVDEIFYELSE
jgi:hypothetical protein